MSKRKILAGGLIGGITLTELKRALALYKVGKTLTVSQLRAVKNIIDQQVHNAGLSPEEVELIHSMYRSMKSIYNKGAKLIP